MDLGSGADDLSVEPGTAITGPTTFHDKLTATLGTGNDQLILGVASAPAQAVFLVSGSTIDGGPGVDAFDLVDSNVMGTVNEVSF